MFFVEPYYIDIAATADRYHNKRDVDTSEQLIIENREESVGIQRVCLILIANGGNVSLSDWHQEYAIH